MGTSGDRSVRSFTALALVQTLLACGPPPGAAGPAAGASAAAGENTTRAADSPPVMPDCGASWCGVPGVPTQVTLSAVWGASPADVWVAGEAGTLLHWNGAAWSTVASGTESALRALAGTSATDVWAAGLDGTLLHFDGASWSAKQSNGSFWSFATGSNARPIYALLALPKQLWAGGSGTRAFDGATWTEPHHGSHLPTMALWGLDASRLWEVGLQGMVNRWDGHHWERLGGEYGPSFYGVWGSTPGEVWVVGSSGSIVRYGGEKPAAVPSGTKQDLYAVRGFGERDVWAVGAQGTILHWQGSAWEPASSPTSSALLGVWGTNASDVWLVGESGVVLHHQG